MLVAAAVIPSAPVLIPDIGGADDADVRPVRDRCRAAVEAVLAVPADRLFVIGGDAVPRSTTLTPWGRPVAVDVPEPLPLSLLVGGWFTAGHVRSFVVVDPALSSPDCVQLGRDLAGSAERIRFVVVGDGSACHTLKAPGYLDDRASGWDAKVHDAFSRLDAPTLTGLEPEIAAELLASGRAPWQVLAGAARDASVHETDAWFDAPFGVGYHVVRWT